MNSKKTIVMFSKACEYAIKSVIYIAQEALAGRKTNVRQISEATDAPEAFRSKDSTTSFLKRNPYF